MKVKTKCFITAFYLIILTIAVSIPLKLKDGVYINKKYKDFWEYTFNGKYKITCIEHIKDLSLYWEAANWLIEYTDKNGIERSGKVSGETEGNNMDECVDYYSIDAVEGFVRKQVNDIISDEFFNKITPQIYPWGIVEDSWKGFKYLDILRYDGTIHIYAQNFSNSSSERVSTDARGYKLADCDLKSVSKDKTIGVEINIILDTNTITEYDFEKIEQLEKAFCDYVGEPCNYVINVLGHSTEIYRKTVVNGDEVKDSWHEYVAPKISG